MGMFLILIGSFVVGVLLANLTRHEKRPDYLGHVERMQKLHNETWNSCKCKHNPEVKK